MHQQTLKATRGIESYREKKNNIKTE
eukprot:UN00634